MSDEMQASLELNLPSAKARWLILNDKSISIFPNITSRAYYPLNEALSLEYILGLIEFKSLRSKYKACQYSNIYVQSHIQKQVISGLMWILQAQHTSWSRI